MTTNAMSNAFPLILILIIFFAVFIGVLIVLFMKTDFSKKESDIKRAGRLGEKRAYTLIKEILKEGDVHLTNVKIKTEDGQAEFDNIIINNRGLFIIEVKNYMGELIGNEEDFEWIQISTAANGSVYQKKIKNPIKQVKRQIFLLSNYLNNNGFDVWVEGYAFFVEMNSPVDSKSVLKTQKDVEVAIHDGVYNYISGEIKEGITNLLSGK